MVSEGGTGSVLDACPYQSKDITYLPFCKSANRRINFVYFCLQTLQQNVYV